MFAPLRRQGPARFTLSRGAALAVFLVSLLACNRSSQQEELWIFAAASAGESFRAMERAFEASHAGVDVVVNFALPVASSSR